MSNFDDFSFDEKKERRESNSINETYNMMLELTEKLEETLAPYKERLRKEFRSLDKNNEIWKKEHDGEDCIPFKKKQWAISAPFNAIKIYKELYINRER